MKVNTLQFGEIECPDDQMITFRNGIPAFEELTKFAVISVEGDAPFSWLQSMENGDLSFIMTNPFLFHPNYDFQLPDSVVEELNIANEQQVAVWAILTVPERLQDATINLLAPIVINMETKQGKQIILHDSTYTTKHRLVPGEASSDSAPEGDAHARTLP